MASSRDNVEAVLEVVRRHVSEQQFRRIVHELLDVPGNASFRDTIRRMASALERPK